MENDQDINIKQKRPFFLSLLCIIVFVYSFVFSMLFIAGMVFSNWITKMLTDFIPDRQFNSSTIFLISILGALLYLISFVSMIYIWKLKRIGFFIYSTVTLILIIIPFFVGQGSLITSAVLIILLILFALFYRRFH